jgi:hypothetical protein
MSINNSLRSSTCSRKGSLVVHPRNQIADIDAADACLDLRQAAHVGNPVFGSLPSVHGAPCTQGSSSMIMRNRIVQLQPSGLSR